MHARHIRATFETFPLPSGMVMDTTVAIPTVKGRWGMKYGEHAYYFMNFRSAVAVRVRINHLDIIRPGWKRLKNAVRKENLRMSVFRPLTLRYHYRFNMLEQVMLMTVPHTATSVGEGRFIVNLWSWGGFLLVDTNARRVTYHLIEDEDTVLGSQQWADPQTGELYAMSYSLRDSISRIKDPLRPVAFRIFKHKLGAPGSETIWQGQLSDYMHDILINETRQYCVACELGMYQDKQKAIIPSKVMIMDIKNNKHWVLDRFVVAAHACFDPGKPDIVYFSNHNFEFMHSNMIKLMKKGSYSVNFRGPASIYKYELTADGPREIGVFTQDDFFRLTNMHVFNHRGRNVIAAMGFPDVVFLIDADSMRFMRTLSVKYPVSLKHFYSRKPALIGTIAPSPDGEKLFVQTTGSFQVIDIDSGQPDYVRDDFFSHICFNHMIACTDTAWGSPGTTS